MEPGLVRFLPYLRSAGSITIVVTIFFQVGIFFLYPGCCICVLEWMKCNLEFPMRDGYVVVTIVAVTIIAVSVGSLVCTGFDESDRVGCYCCAYLYR